MDATEYNRARKNLLSEIEEKRKDLEALERVFTRKIFPTLGRAETSPGSESNGKYDPAVRAESQSVGKGELLRAIREWIGKRNGRDFTAVQLIAGLQEAGFEAKPGSTKSVIARLVEEKALKVVTQGAGRRASVYKEG